MNILLVFQQMLILMLMMAIGFFTCRLGWIQKETHSTMSKLVIFIFNTCLIVHSVIGKSADSGNHIFLQNLVLVLLFYGLLFLLGFAIVAVLRIPCHKRPIYRMMTLLPNIGFMGIPIVAALLGTEYILYVAVYMLFYNLIIYTYGIALCQKANLSSGDIRNQKKRSLWQKLRPVVTNPGVIASVIALFIFFMQISIPSPVQTFLEYMGNPAIPLSMYLIGCSVAFSDLRSLVKDIKIYGFLLIKMLVFPILCALLVRWLPFDATILKLFVIMASMPAGTMVVLMAEEYANDSDAATKGVILSTLSSVFTVPIVSLFM